MRNYFKYWTLCIVSIGFFSANAGSYEDFFAAIRKDDAQTITSLIQRGFEPNTPDPDGLHPLMLAVQLDSLKAARALAVAPRMRLDARNPHDETPLMLASLRGHTELARELIARQADVNKTGWTPLHYAATRGHRDMMRLLLDHEAYIDSEADNGTTPLMMAAYSAPPLAVKLLLEDYAFFANDLDLFAQRLDLLTELKGKAVVNTMNINHHFHNEPDSGSYDLSGSLYCLFNGCRGTW